jgi:hypothetical protein
MSITAQITPRLLTACQHPNGIVETCFSKRPRDQIAFERIIVYNENGLSTRHR